MATRAILLRAPEQFLAERRRLGHGDEMWDGVLHMTPPPPAEHGQVVAELERRLAGLGGTVCRSFLIQGDGERDYRIADLAVVDAAGRIELVVEVLAPGDESRAKLPWYAARGVPEVWLVDPATMATEIVAL
jgi:Uma2 family endonuclease